MTQLPAQKITVLGSTGSVGISTLDVISRHPASYRPCADCQPEPCVDA